MNRRIPAHTQSSSGDRRAAEHLPSPTPTGEGIHKGVKPTAAPSEFTTRPSPLPALRDGFCTVLYILSTLHGSPLRRVSPTSSFSAGPQGSLAVLVPPKPSLPLVMLGTSQGPRHVMWAPRAALSPCLAQLCWPAGHWPSPTTEDVPYGTSSCFC